VASIRYLPEKSNPEMAAVSSLRGDRMAQPQDGIFRDGSPFHYFLEYNLSADADGEAIRAALAQALEPASPDSGVSLVAAFGEALWTRLSPGWAPPGFRAFEPIGSEPRRRAPATQRDLWIWIHGEHHDRNFDRALRIQRALDPVGRLELEQGGFTYLDSRDLTGFIDGSANPTGDDARAAALLPAGSPGGDGSFVITQRWVHDLAAFHELPVAEQERVIGRTKLDSVEFDENRMPADAHVARTDFGEKIYRRSVPYGTLAEHGLYFLAFSRDIDRFAVLLDRMFGTTDDGVHDRLTQFSTPVSGSFWFAPSRQDLDELLGAARS
jgi:putative iron-dependent peroxidase